LRLALGVWSVGGVGGLGGVNCEGSLQASCRQYEHPHIPPTQTQTQPKHPGPVTYNTDNMLDKNRDFVISEHQALLSASTVPLAAALFPSAAADGGGGNASPSPTPRGGAAGGRMPRPVSTANLKGFQFVSVGSQFKRQLAELAAKLSELQPHYVRCIKPNPRNEHMLLDKGYTLEQLKCGLGAAGRALLHCV